MAESKLDEETIDASRAIEANVERITRLISNSARHMAAKLNGAVYLVGSTLHNPSPRDCDIRVVVADAEFGARYGLTMKPTTKAPEPGSHGWTHCIAWNEDGPTQRWIDDCAKTGAEFSTALSLNVDYKVWPLSYWRARTWPTPVVLAAPSPSWFIYSALCPDPAATLPREWAEAVYRARGVSETPAVAPHPETPGDQPATPESGLEGV